MGWLEAEEAAHVLQTLADHLPPSIQYALCPDDEDRRSAILRGPPTRDEDDQGLMKNKDPRFSLLPSLESEVIGIVRRQDTRTVTSRLYETRGEA